MQQIVEPEPVSELMSHEEESKPADESKGGASMFNEEDYWPYIIGMFVFAGLIAIPALWSMFIDFPYPRLVAGSLVGCGVFAYAHTRDGQFQFSRFLGAFFLVLLMSLKASVSSDAGITAFIPGGMLSFLMMSAGGWLGIAIGRKTRLNKALSKF